MRLKAFADTYEIQNQLNNLNKNKENLDKLLSDKIYDNYKKLEEKDNAILNQERYITELITEFEENIKEFDKKQIPDFGESGINENPSNKKKFGFILEALKDAKSHIQQVIERLKTIKIKIRSRKKNLGKNYSK